jgi:hypothetical protein
VSIFCIASALRDSAPYLFLLSKAKGWQPY